MSYENKKTFDNEIYIRGEYGIDGSLRWKESTSNTYKLQRRTSGLWADANVEPFKWVDVTVAATDLDSAGTKNVIAGATGAQYKIREIRLVGGGTNYAAGGDRAISLTDGTTVWTTIANADIESAPSATLAWGNAKVPFLTGTSDTASVAGQAIRFAYSGGTTDHSGTGSIKFSVLLEKVA